MIPAKAVLLAAWSLSFTFDRNACQTPIFGTVFGRTFALLMPTRQTQEISGFWDDLYKQGRDYKLINSRKISSLLQYTDPHLRKVALDIGCGTGQLSRELYHRGYKVVGIDISNSAIEIARSLTTVSPGKLSYLSFDIERNVIATLPSQPYGLITCKLVYAFIRDKQVFLTKVASLLDNRGIFVVITPLLEQIPDEKKNIAVSSEDIELLRQHFEQIAWYEEGFLGYFIGKRK